jgi:uncharacterized membrane protein
MPPEKAPLPSKSGKSSTLLQLGAFLKDERTRAMAVYALLLFMPMSMGFTGVLAITLIYLVQDSSTDLTRGHYVFQKNTFWYAVGGIIASLLVMGLRVPFLFYVIFIPTFVWIVARCVVGFNHLLHMRPHPDPKTLLA